MNVFDRITPYMHWALRLALGSVFLYHGLTKFPVLSGLAEMMGMPVVMVGLLASMETIGALLILGGYFGPSWLTRLGGMLIIPVMIGAIVMVHWPHGWNSVNMGTGNMGRGMEFQFTLLMLALYFFVTGNHHASGVSPESEAASTPAHREAVAAENDSI